MNCIKTINIEHEYGTVKLFLLTGLTFIIVFCCSYVINGLLHAPSYTDRYFSLFLLSLVSLYPIHKFIHYICLIRYRKSLVIRMKVKFTFVPILNMRIKEIIPKWHYLMSLIAPSILLNSFFLFCMIAWSAFAHYFCLLLAFHCSICVLDFLHVKNIWSAPKHAKIEETPKGYEILVPQY